MSSSRPADNRPALRRGGRAWTLRARLLAMLMLVMVAVCLTVGVTTAVVVRDNLIDQTDQRLDGARDRILAEQIDYRRPGGPPRGEPPSFLGARGLGPGTLGAQIVDGEAVAAGLVSAKIGPSEPLSAEADPVLESLPVDGHAHSRDIPGLGAYRLLATLRPEGDVIITGVPLGPVNQTLTWLVLVEVAVSLVALLAAGLGGSALIRVTLKPLNRVAATAGRVAELPLHAGDVALAERVPAVYTDPGTEVGQVGAALNRLLGHVDSALAARQASETRLRQFVADASHELRTPLAAIRGYAELGRREDVDTTGVLERVESQAKRMTALVEDLLLLARIDAGRPLERGPVDLSALVVECVGDAHVAGPDHRWRLDLPDEPVVVVGDNARLHQVLANLLANARAHTPPDTVVTVGLTESGRLTVTDNGPGIPADLQPHIFQRFTRGDSSRSRTAGSTGLGLSIVAAVVTAHGGTVTVDSVPGRTTFTVTLPLVPGRNLTDGAQDQHTAAIAGPSTVEK
jgi:two-component system, OmpR family, sensor kinase